MKILTIKQDSIFITVWVQILSNKKTTRSCGDQTYWAFLSKYLTGAFSRFCSESLAVAFASVP